MTLEICLFLSVTAQAERGTGSSAPHPDRWAGESRGLLCLPFPLPRGREMLIIPKTSPVGVPDPEGGDGLLRLSQAGDKN